MTLQTATVYCASSSVILEFPAPEAEVLPGILWGRIDAFPSPAYWAYQVLARRLEGKQLRYRLGRTFTEEVVACLLGGHGIPAAVGVTAFEHLKSRGLLSGASVSETVLVKNLQEPIQLSDGKMVRYRFAKQKARYLHAALAVLEDATPPFDSGIELRNWLLQIPGIGLKTASWIVRNWLDSDEVAIIDIHIQRAGVLGGFFSREWTVERHYEVMERRFLETSAGLGVRASELDAVIWYEMMSSPASVQRVLAEQARPEQQQRDRALRMPSSNKSNADTNQLSLCV